MHCASCALAIGKQVGKLDGIIGDAMKAYEVWSKDKNNAVKEFRYEIDINRPNKEKQNEK